MESNTLLELDRFGDAGGEPKTASPPAIAISTSISYLPPHRSPTSPTAPKTLHDETAERARIATKLRRITDQAKHGEGPLAMLMKSLFTDSALYPGTLQISIVPAAREESSTETKPSRRTVPLSTRSSAPARPGTALPSSRSFNSKPRLSSYASIDPSIVPVSSTRERDAPPTPRQLVVQLEQAALDPTTTPQPLNHHQQQQERPRPRTASHPPKLSLHHAASTGAVEMPSPDLAHYMTNAAHMSREEGESVLQSVFDRLGRPVPSVSPRTSTYTASSWRHDDHLKAYQELVKRRQHAQDPMRRLLKSASRDLNWITERRAKQKKLVRQLREEHDPIYLFHVRRWFAAMTIQRWTRIALTCRKLKTNPKHILLLMAQSGMKTLRPQSLYTENFADKMRRCRAYVNTFSDAVREEIVATHMCVNTSAQIRHAAWRQWGRETSGITLKYLKPPHQLFALTQFQDELDVNPKKSPTWFEADQVGSNEPRPPSPLHTISQ